MKNLERNYQTLYKLLMILKIISLIKHFHLFFSFLLKNGLYLCLQDLFDFISCVGVEKRDLTMAKI